MNKLFVTIAGLGIAVTALPTAASAQSFQAINQRQSNLYGRIDQGIRSGALNRNEAQRMRIQFRQIVNLEQRYRRNGLSRAERSDLNRRFDTLSARIRAQKNDRQYRR